MPAKVAAGEGTPTLDQVQEFHSFLMGRLPADVSMAHPPKLSGRMAFDIIWFLQEHMHLIPDVFERCVHCGWIFDSESEGRYVEKTGRHYCDNCAHFGGGS